VSDDRESSLANVDLIGGSDGLDVELLCKEREKV
jgi:hypothetical protein